MLTSTARPAKTNRRGITRTSGNSRMLPRGFFIFICMTIPPSRASPARVSQPRAAARGRRTPTGHSSTVEENVLDLLPGDVHAAGGPRAPHNCPSQVHGARVHFLAARQRHGCRVLVVRDG